MNLYEKLNRLNDSLVESKRVVKKKKLTESVDNMPLFHALEAKVEKLADELGFDLYVSETETDGDTVELWCTELADIEGTGLVDVIELSEDSKQYLFDVEYVKDYLSTVFDEYYDDDIDEMLTESTEQYELSTLVKDSINHLVNDLGKDPMADDFGDDVCADLENNYAIDVPQEPVRYANWCSAVMSEVSRQLNNKEEQLTESMSFSWLDIQNQIALEQQEGKNPFYEDSVAGDHVLELMGKVEKELNVEVVPSVQGGYGDVFIHIGNDLHKSEKIIDPIDFNKFSSDMINLVLEADTENEFVNNYKAELLAYID